jgi:hypothetical protein
MIFNNKLYDILKYIALIVLPGIATLYLSLSYIWGLPYGEAVAGTITAIDTFLGALLGISAKTYELHEQKAALEYSVNVLKENSDVEKALAMRKLHKAEDALIDTPLYDDKEGE